MSRGRPGEFPSFTAATDRLTNYLVGIQLRSCSPSAETSSLTPQIAEFATDSLLERDGFETPVPDERVYGLAASVRVMGLPFGASLLGFKGAYQMKRRHCLPTWSGSWS